MPARPRQPVTPTLSGKAEHISRIIYTMTGDQRPRPQSKPRAGRPELGQPHTLLRSRPAPVPRTDRPASAHGHHSEDQSRCERRTTHLIVAPGVRTAYADPDTVICRVVPPFRATPHWLWQPVCLEEISLL